MMARRQGDLKEMEVLRVGRYDDITDPENVTVVSNCPSHGRRSFSGSSGDDKGGLREKQQQEVYSACIEPTHAVGITSLPSSHQPITKPAVVFGPTHEALDTSTATNVSCTPSDFRDVEEELRELLSGYRRLVGKADGKHMRSEKSTPMKKTAAEATGFRGVSMVEASSIDTTQDDVAGEDGNLQPHSITSLPVSSVHGDRSTDANTLTSSVQMPRHAESIRGGVHVEGGETALCTAVSYATNPSAHMSSPVDLFVDALTEDQINRSFEMQWQREQRKQLLLHHAESVAPILHMVPNGNSRQISLESNPFPDDIDVSYPVIRQEAGSPLPPFVNRRKLRLDHGRDTFTASSEVYDGRALAAYRHPGGILSAHGKPSPDDAFGGKGALDGRMNVRFGSGAPRHSAQRADEGKPEFSHRKNPPDSAAARSIEREGRSYSSTMKKQVLLFRGGSRPSNKGGDSITPEIATSARRTENPSMNNGVTGSKETIAALRRVSMYNKQDVKDTFLGPTMGGGAGGVGATLANSRVTQAGNAGLDSGSGERDHFGLHNLQTHRNPPIRERGRAKRRKDAATRFHVIVERRVAALEAGSNAAVALPAFADSLVGAAISDFFPAVKRRQAQLKESQHAQAAAAALRR